MHEIQIAPPSWSLASKSAIVTGGSRGIGRAIAIHLARKGLSKLAVTYVGNVASAESTLHDCRKLGVEKAIAIQANLLDPSIGTNLIAQVLGGLDTSTIDILVNNAAVVTPDKTEPVTETTLGTFLEMMQGNVFAPISIINACMPHLPASCGRVINISSTAAKMANPDPIMTYGASKAALDSYTRSLAGLFAKEKGATFNGVCVGPTATDALNAASQTFSSEFLEDLTKGISAAHRVGVPEDIAYIVGFLASEEARWVNGACVSANGGYRDLLPVLG